MGNSKNRESLDGKPKGVNREIKKEVLDLGNGKVSVDGSVGNRESAKADLTNGTVDVAS